jgi:hypothetical protein
MKVSSRILSILDRNEFREDARKKSIEVGISISNEVKPDVNDIFEKLTSN